MQCWILQRKIKVIAFICLFVISFQLIQKLPTNLTISFLDVGQGDCTLITTPNHKSILIDGGGSSNLEAYDVGKKVLLPYLLNHHIKQIDVMMISHFDADHVCGLIAILENLKVKKLVIGKQKEESEEYNNIMKIVSDKKIPVQILQEGETLKIDSEVFFDVLYPENILYEKGLNNNSLVLRLNFNQFHMLFTGDIEKEAENRLLSSNLLEATVLKVAHHGSKTSTTSEFLNAVNPKIAIIRSGKK